MKIRLIDADVLKRNMEFVCMGIMAGTENYNAPLTEIDNAPTVEPICPYLSDDEVKQPCIKAPCEKPQGNQIAWEQGYEAGLAQGKSERPQGEWIPVSERLPRDLEPVNITWINHEPEPYYKEIKGKPFTATGVYFNGQWYWWSTLCTDTLAEYSNNYDDIIDKAVEVIAWQPLPEPYKKGANNG